MNFHFISAFIPHWNAFCFHFNNFFRARQEIWIFHGALHRRRDVLSRFARCLYEKVSLNWILWLFAKNYHNLNIFAEYLRIKWRVQQKRFKVAPGKDWTCCVSFENSDVQITIIFKIALHPLWHSCFLFSIYIHYTSKEKWLSAEKGSRFLFIPLWYLFKMQNSCSLRSFRQ